MQIVSLSQYFNSCEMIKMGTNESDLIVTYYVTTDYETFSKLAYLRPTLLLMDFTRVLRGSL
ncbi:hypothetical protein JCM15640A_07920 [Hoylesella timonensis 4401737 = DSM 22865 = JCM 15640]